MNTARYIWPVMAALFAVIYYQLLAMDPLLLRDDHMLLKPLELIYSWPELWDYMFATRNPDVQPIRDLSMFADIWILRHWGIHTFHLQNLVIWAATCLAFLSLLQRIGIRASHARSATLLFALHPLNTACVSWVSARKHLLAYLFLILALDLFFRIWNAKAAVPKSSYFLFLIFYCFSVLSQPIFALLPIWIAGYYALEYFPIAKKNDRIQFFATLAILFLLMAAFLAWNRAHYESYYAFVREDPEKYSSLEWTSITGIMQILLAYGRGFYQILIPNTFAVTYSAESIENKIGLMLLLPFFLVCLKMLRWRTTLAWMGLFLLLPALPILKVRTLFLTDTYLLGAALAIWILFLLLVEKIQIPLTGRKIILARFLYAALILLFTIESIADTKMWLSENEMWQNAYEKEPTCLSSLNYGLLLFKRDENIPAVRAVDFYIRNKCHEGLPVPIFFLSIYYQDQLTLPEKLRILEQNHDSEQGRITYAALLLDAGKPGEAKGFISGLLRGDRAFWKRLHRIEIEPLRRSLQAYCSRDPDFEHCYLGKVESPNKI